LNVVEIVLPPLRERRQDIPLLVQHFLEKTAQEMGRDAPVISEGAMKLLFEYDWPGNVRELENAIERAMVTCRSQALGEESFHFLVRGNGKPWQMPPNLTLQDLEKLAIVATLDRTKGNIKEAAASLGIDRSTLYEKIKRYEIAR
jgi:two-component system response regulator HydG